jgi:hypothetical protein
VAVLLGERLVGLIPPDGHDWRLFVTPAELARGMAGAGLKMDLEDVKGLEPRPRALAALALYQTGLLPKERLLEAAGGGTEGGAFAITGLTQVSYIGSAARV